MATLTDTITRTAFDTPNMWAIVFFNDDYTPFDFVESVLTRFLYKTSDEAHQIASKVHNEGRAKVGRYTKEIAMTKVMAINTWAAQAGHPLKTNAEEL